MYTMQNLNVVKLVATESERDYLKSRGFKEVIAENKSILKKLWNNFKKIV